MISSRTSDSYDQQSKRQPSPYERSLQKLVIEAEKRFWANNELRSREGHIEEGCPPGTYRTDIPRSKTFDPMLKACYQPGKRWGPAEAPAQDLHSKLPES